MKIKPDSIESFTDDDVNTVRAHLEQAVFDALSGPNKVNETCSCAICTRFRKLDPKTAKLMLDHTPRPS